MTDYTKLIERLRKYDRSRDFIWTANIDAADAIEALQAENTEVKRLRDEWEREAKELLTERDALQAKLDELQRQEPAGHFLRNYGEEDLWLCCKAEIKGMTEPLYAAPKALEPLTDEQILEAIRNAPKMQTTYAGWVRDQRIAWGRAIEAAHGITKGTP